MSRSDIPCQSHHLSRRVLPIIQHRDRDRDISYPEIDIKVSTSSKFPISNLESDGHDIVTVQCFVEAFSCVSLELDGVCGRGGNPPQRGDQDGAC